MLLHLLSIRTPPYRFTMSIHFADLSVYCEYFQFYIRDGGLAPAAPTDWNYGDIEALVKLKDGLIAIRTASDLSVDVKVEITDSEPEVTLENFDHVVRCSLTLTTGYLQVHECIGEEKLRLKVQPGAYSALLLYSNLNAAQTANGDGGDSYHLYFWLGKSEPLKIIKDVNDDDAI